MSDEARMAAASGFVGLCAGIALAVIFNLHTAALTEALLSFLGDIAGAGLGAGVAIVFAVWAAGGERRRARHYAVQQSLVPVQTLIDTTHDLATCAPEELRDTLEHATFAEKRLRNLLAGEELTDFYLRKAYAQAADAFSSRKATIEAAIPEQIGRKLPRRAPADSLLMELFKVRQAYERVRSF